MPDFEAKLEELFIELPDKPYTAVGRVSFSQIGKTLYIGNQLPFSSGKLSFKGRLGLEINLDQGRLACRYATLHALSTIRQAVGSLNKVDRIVQISAYVASGGDFVDHEKVLDSSSELLKSIFGERGKFSQIAVGVGGLPWGACVAISMIVALR